MPTYIYSPNQKNKSKSNASNYKRNKASQKSNLLSMYSAYSQPITPVTQSQPVAQNNRKTLTYQTTAPKIVNKRYTQRANGGYTLAYNLENAKIVTEQKPKLKFIQVAKLISPRSLK